MSEDPYATVAEALGHLKAQLKKTLDTHQKFLLQNLSVMNDLKSMKEFPRELEESMAESRLEGQNGAPEAPKSG